eukprot:scaffold12965_cov241-Isochrysis_galbana.AAC.1
MEASSEQLACGRGTRGAWVRISRHYRQETQSRRKHPLHSPPAPLVAPLRMAEIATQKGHIFFHCDRSVLYASSSSRSMRISSSSSSSSIDMSIVSPHVHRSLPTVLRSPAVLRLSELRRLNELRPERSMPTTADSRDSCSDKRSLIDDSRSLSEEERRPVCGGIRTCSLEAHASSAYACATAMVLDGSDSAPVPARLVAQTTNRYAGCEPGGLSAPSWDIEMDTEGADGSAPETVSMSRSRLLVQLAPSSNETDRRYPVSIRPPSLAGGFHSRRTVPASAATATSPCGWLGLWRCARCCEWKLLAEIHFLQRWQYRLPGCMRPPLPEVDFAAEW